MYKFALDLKENLYKLESNFSKKYPTKFLHSPFDDSKNI